MSGNQQNTEQEVDDGFEPRPVKAESVLPLKAAGIES